MINFPQKLTITWIKNQYKNKTLTPKELIDEIIRRAEETTDYKIWIVKPSKDLIYNFLEKLPEDSSDYPLWGIPFAIKDNIDLENVETTAACPKFAYTAKENATVVDKLIKAGAIPVGKTNLDQFATGLVGTRSPYGEVKNALNPEYISGGSSSGSAVSVALGMSAFALGTDTAGSGRVPAMLNNLVGFKPALGSWSTKGVVPACASLDCVTVFANSLEDCLLVDENAKGFDSECPWSRVYEEKGLKKPSKVILPKECPKFFGKNEQLHKVKWEAAIERIKNMGLKISYVDYEIFYEAALILYEGAYVAERWCDLKDFVEANEKDIFPVTYKILKSGDSADKTAARLFEDLHKLQYYRQKAKEILKDAVMIMPTAGGSFTRDEVRENPIETNSLMGLYTNHCNLLDLMAIALPENSTDTNLPFGITVFGLANNSNLVIDFSKRFLSSEEDLIAVCGLHKKGFPLEYQLLELGARFVKSTKTSRNYKLFRLNSEPVKPALVRSATEPVNEIAVDIYSLPKDKFGAFFQKVNKPLSLGNVELMDGSWVKGFLAEEYAYKEAEEITKEGSF